jgi:hypothetical protein
MNHSHHGGRWLRWLIVDHLLLILLILMLATIFSIPLFISMMEANQQNESLEQSAPLRF